MTRRRWPWFMAWFAVGAAYELSLLGAMTIGIFVLPFAVGATIWLVTRRGATVGITGLVSGLGLPLLYVAYLNREGTGKHLPDARRRRERLH